MMSPAINSDDSKGIEHKISIRFILAFIYSFLILGVPYYSPLTTLIFYQFHISCEFKAKGRCWHAVHHLHHFKAVTVHGQHPPLSGCS